jgi:hypothetical protein
MTNAVDFHDYTIESLLVDVKARRLVLRAFDGHAPGAPTLIAEFGGLAGYYLLGDVLGTIVFELEERDPVDLYRRFAPQMQATYANSGGHDPWVETEDGAVAFLAANRIRGFELSSSIGANGAIWCRQFNKWVESGEAA